jgi:hypothetical protein
MIQNSIMVFRFWQTTFLCCAIIALFNACDTITTPDIITVTGKPLPTVMYVPSGGSALLDLTIAVNSAAQVSIAQNARNGLLSFEEGRFIRYSAKTPFLIDGEDLFILKFDEKETIIKVVIVNNSKSCEVGILSDKATTNVNKPISLNLTANDLFCNSPDLTTFFIVTPPKNGQLTTRGGTITYTPNKDFIGTDKIVYTVSGRGFTQESGVAEVLIDVKDPNNCFTSLTGDAYAWASTAANPSLVIDVLENDALCNLLKNSLFIELQPKYGSAKIENNKLTYTTTAANFATGNFELIRYGLRDSSGTSFTATVFIQLFCAVKLVDDYAEWTRNATTPSYTFNILNNDTLCIANTPTISFTKKPTNGTISLSPNLSAIYTPNTGFKGLDSFKYSLIDNIGIIRSANVRTKVN